MSLRLFNTLGKSLQDFTLPDGVDAVRMYNCGPTVYGTQHIGNLSMFVFTNVLRRVLEYNGFVVKQVINITDFGHLTGDNAGNPDEGEDKMTKGLKREGMQVTMENMAMLAERYTQIFLADLRLLNIDTERIEFPRASAYIAAQIAMIKTLEEKGYTYQGAEGVYYDTSRFPAYGALGGIDLDGLKAGARVAASADKRNATDFLLWKSDPKIGWDSPWGTGFPGWHIECSAMIRSTLGDQIDIHTGGIEHIPIHHNNEIAQSEAATDKKPFSRFWMHRGHLQLDGGKFAKSEGRVVYLSDVIERGYHPLALRYLFLGAHYRTSANFSWEALAAAQTALVKLVALRLSLTSHHTSENRGVVSISWREKFLARINDDLDTPGAVAIVWEMTKDKSLSGEDLVATLIDFDRVLGLGIGEPDEQMRALVASEIKEEIPIDSLPADVRTLINEREAARKAKDFAKADALRIQIEDTVTLEDTAAGVRAFKK